MPAAVMTDDSELAFFNKSPQQMLQEEHGMTPLEPWRGSPAPRIG
jgi:hypothetical protein